MNSLYIGTKRYFDKTGGNSYFASRVEVDGVEVLRLPFQYGYESADEYTALHELQKLGVLPFEAQSLWSAVRDAGAAFYRAPIAYFTKREVKRWGESN
jgi:hypothetical protein